MPASTRISKKNVPSVAVAADSISERTSKNTNDTKSTFESVEVKDEVVKCFREERREVEKSGESNRNIEGRRKDDAKKPEIVVVVDSDDAESKAKPSSDEVCVIDDEPVATISDMGDKSSDLVGGEKEKSNQDIDIEESSGLVVGELEMVSKVDGELKTPVSTDVAYESPAQVIC